MDDDHRRRGDTVDRRPVVVGYTPTDAGDAALRVAAREARIRGTRLMIMRVPPDPRAAPDRQADGLNVNQRHAAIAQLMVQASHARSGLKVIDVRSASQPLAVELLRCSLDASLVVVGIARSSSPKVVTIDATSRVVVDRGHCPVLVVPAGTTDSPPAAIVCGVARSESSGIALRWAAAQARRRQVGLIVVPIGEGLAGARSGTFFGPSFAGWLRRELPSEDAVRSIDQSHRTVEELIEIAEQHRALLVIGNSGRNDRAERTFVHGLTAQTRVPVVVVGQQPGTAQTLPATAR